MGWPGSGRGDPGRPGTGPDRGKRGSASPAAARAAGDEATACADASGTDAPDPDRAAARRRRRARADAAGLGRSRGGLSSKIHAAVDATGLPLSFVLTPGQAADCPQFQTVLDKIRLPGPVGRPRTRSDAVAADRVYSSRANRVYLRWRHISAVIPEKTDQQPTARRRARPEDGRSPTIPNPTNSATPSNAASRRSRPGAARPPATTKLPTATRPDSTSADRSCG
ncbi:transposase [Streptomyces sp. NPDC002018]|uniref:transposase n=1 Tax=Streptomyces sp. NPDC002018 TaxID=3364629 RepID=UPI0036BA036B